MKAQVVRISLPLLVLCLFYLAIYRSPGAGRSEALALLSPRQTRELLDLSRKYLREKKPEEALGLTEKLHQNYPQNHIYIEQLATIYHLLERYREEAESWELYMQSSPTPVEACPQLGEAYRRQGLIPETLKACQRCLALDEKNVDSLFFLALAYERSNQLDKATEFYERAVRLYPPYPDTRIGLARVSLRQGKTARAEELISRVYEQTPNHVDGLLVFGMTMRSAGRLAEAKRYLLRGAELSPTYGDFYVVLGGIAEQEGDINEAVRCYDRVLELAPENRDIARRRNQLRGGGA
jgi:tetratricopeptide (TPR) repeat protein